MKTWKQKRERKLKLILAATTGCALAAFALNACNGAGNQPVASPPPAVNLAPSSAGTSSMTAMPLAFPKECETVSADVSGISIEAQNSIVGTYFGTFTRMRGQSVSQPFSLIVSRGHSQNRPFFYATLRSKGSAGSIEQALCLSLSLNGLPDLAGGTTYVFESPEVLPIPALSKDFDLAVELRVVLRPGYRVDPTQSAITIKDCVLSEECTALDVELAGFGKR